jgi:hypothetical protein
VSREPGIQHRLAAGGVWAQERLGIAMVRFPFLPSLAVLLCFTAAPDSRAEPRAVLELFTSQGCSSCPAADKLVGELASDPNVIVLTLAVDYWDYLGWKDTLALKGHVHRQRAYAKARGDRNVYTPQVVVNGISHVLGSDRVAIEQAIRETRSNAASPLRVPVRLTVTDEKLTVELPASDAGKRGEVWLCPVKRAVPVEIARGENKGKVVTYTNVVRRWVRLGEYNGQAEVFTLPRGALDRDIDAIAVLVQPPSQADTPRVVIGAAQAALR